MRRHHGLILPALLAAGLLPAAAADVFVSTTGNDTTGDGSQGTPYRTIQHAFDVALDGDTIRVLPGTYNECVRAVRDIGESDKDVAFVAQNFGTQGNSVTIIDGTSTCGPLTANPDATVTLLGANKSINGFTIRGGGLSGINIAGGATITNNLITGNTSTGGGGIYGYNLTCYYGDTNITIADNTIRQNTVASDVNGDFGDGGGVILVANSTLVNVDPSNPCPVGGDATATINHNTITANTAETLGAGLEVFTNSAIEQATPTLFGHTTVTITNNTITANSFIPGAGYGGGAWLQTYGYGEENIVFTGNTVAGNNSTGDGGGVSAWINTAGNLIGRAQHSILLENNSVTGNDADGNGGGFDLFAITDTLLADQKISIVARNNTVTGNTASGVTGGGGGVLGTYLSQRSVVTDSTFEISGNRITGNSAVVSGGGASLIVSADACPPGAPACAPAEAEIALRQNRISDNDSNGGAGGNAVGGGVFVYLEAIGQATATADIELNTIARNHTDTGAGGIEVESFTDEDPGAVHEGQVVLNLNSNIVANNDSFGLGGPPPDAPGVLQPGPGNTANRVINRNYNDFFGNQTNFESGFGVLPGELGNIAVDPLLGTNDVPQRCSPTIDAGDPAFDESDEPQPNGGLINMGHSGGTTNAVTTLADVNGDSLVDGIDVLRLAVAFGAAPGAPRFNAAADLDGDGMVDGADLAFIAADYGERCP